MTRRIQLPTSGTPPGGRIAYRDRIFDDLRHDPYQAKGKYKQPAACSDCGAVFRRGRWQWGTAPNGALTVRCPACRRMRDKLPAGYLTVDGAFLEQHRDELLQLVHNEAERERSEHALHRIMDIAAGPESLVVTTTDIHLPRRIGHALESAYQGRLELRYAEDEYALRAHWQR
jgi:hypothetical protein